MNRGWYDKMFTFLCPIDANCMRVFVCLHTGYRSCAVWCVTHWRAIVSDVGCQFDLSSPPLVNLIWCVSVCYAAGRFFLVTKPISFLGHSLCRLIDGLPHFIEREKTNKLTAYFVLGKYGQSDCQLNKEVMAKNWIIWWKYYLYASCK